jgi:hypothetical protein
MRQNKSIINLIGGRIAALNELASDIVLSHASRTPMASEDILTEIQKALAALKVFEAGTEGPEN